MNQFKILNSSKVTLKDRQGRILQKFSYLRQTQTLAVLCYILNLINIIKGNTLNFEHPFSRFLPKLTSIRFLELLFVF